MKFINNSLWVNLEDHLDMTSFDNLHDKIIFAIAKNSDYIEPSYTPKYTMLNFNANGFLEEKYKYKGIYPELNQSQLNWYTKLTGAITLGTQLVIRRNFAYHVKHLKLNTEDTPCAFDFNFLFDWIEEQKCFTEYGRVMFWINEPSQQTAFHTDYGDINSNKKDMFIWLTGKFKKKILIKDTDTDIIHASPFRALTFNTVNWHGSCGDTDYSSWSLRIDGIFSKSWAESVGIKDYYGL